MPSDSSARSEDRLFLRRYTSLPVLVDMLHHRRVTLVDPERWPDKNDTAFLEAYKEKRKLKTLVAVCLTATSERFHHWNVFASGPAGVCIEFRREAFLEAVGSIAGVRHGPVTYREIEQLDKMPPAIDDLPFLKRFPYIDENEYRVVYERKSDQGTTKDIPLDLAWVNRIYLSPWLHPDLREATVSMIKRFPDCGELTVFRTTLLKNARWLKHAERLPASGWVPVPDGGGA